MPPRGSDAEGAMPVVASEKLALLADKALECASSVQTLPLPLPTGPSSRRSLWTRFRLALTWQRDTGLNHQHRCLVMGKDSPVAARPCGLT